MKCEKLNAPCRMVSLFVLTILSDNLKQTVKTLHDNSDGVGPSPSLRSGSRITAE